MPDYVQNYLRAIRNPLPEMRSAFEAEFSLLERHAANAVVLDMGCGAGRPAIALSACAKMVIGIDNDPEMLATTLGTEYYRNLLLRFGDAMDTPFLDRKFDMTYATYNLIGSIPAKQRQGLVDEMARVTRKRGHVITFTWKNDGQTTDFLRQYYPSIGIELLDIDEQRAVTSKGTFDRVSEVELRQYYRTSGITVTDVLDVGPVWKAIVGNVGTNLG